MPSPSTSDLEIANRACVMAGCKKVAAFDVAYDEVAIALNEIYEDIVEDCLSIHPWRFASFTEPLGPPLDPPPVGFSAAYALPIAPRALQVRTVYLNGAIASRYKVMAEQLWVDAGANEAVELEALWRVATDTWPPWFRLYAILRLASFLAGSITRSGDIATFYGGEAEKQLVRSRTRDSQQQTTQKIRLVKTRSARLGGRPY